MTKEERKAQLFKEFLADVLKKEVENGNEPVSINRANRNQSNKRSR